MDGHILSQDEVNALLRGVAAGEVDTRPEETPEKEEAGRTVRTYNLASQERVVRGRMPTLEMVNERFARFFQVSLAALLRKSVEFTPVSIEMIKYSEFIKKVPLPSNINILRLEPMNRNFLFIIDARAVFNLVDHLCGGVGRGQIKVEGRDFSPIENRMTRTVLTHALDDFEKAWRPVHTISAVYLRSEVNPQFAMIVSPTEMVIALAYHLDIDGQGRPVYICLPYTTVEPIKEKLYTGFHSDQYERDSRWTIRFRTQLESVPVRLVAELGTATVRLSEVLAWKKGDVLPLNQQGEAPIRLKVEQAVRFLVRPGQFRSNRAVRIVARIFPEAEDTEPFRP